MKLVDQMIIEHMFHLTKTQVITFINSALIIGTEAPREGFYRANLVFTKHGKLSVCLSVCLCLFNIQKKNSKVLTNTLKDIQPVCCASALPMDGSFVDKTQSQSVINYIKLYFDIVSKCN